MPADSLDDDLEPVSPGPFVSSILVRDLFGRYNYKFHVPGGDAETPGRLVLLYGENGSGKTTILNVLWHLLSRDDNKGHRTAIAQTPFRTFAVNFSDGSALIAEKSKSIVGSFTVTVHQPDKKECHVIYEVDDGGVVPPLRHQAVWLSEELIESRYSRRDVHKFNDKVNDNARSEVEYFSFLKRTRFNPMFLADDRSLYTDDRGLARARERAELRAAAEMDVRPGAHEGNFVEQELRVTLVRVNEYLRSLTFAGQSEGSQGANSIYADLLRSLTRLPRAHDSEGEAPDFSVAQDLLADVAENSPRFEEFELVPRFDSSEFSQLLERLPDEAKRVAAGILVPYFESLVKRMEALGGAESILRALITILNGFFVDKKFVFSPRHGLRIVTTGGDRLEPSSLSSGERQLTMLLCNTLLARNRSRLFLIDEPELSLGVRWQRNILGALLTLTEGSGLQFFVATHSVEMISSERQHLVKLQRQ